MCDRTYIVSSGFLTKKTRNGRLFKRLYVAAADDGDWDLSFDRDHLQFDAGTIIQGGDLDGRARRRI